MPKLIIELELSNRELRLDNLEDLSSYINHYLSTGNDTLADTYGNVHVTSVTLKPDYQFRN